MNNIAIDNSYYSAYQNSTQFDNFSSVGKTSSAQAQILDENLNNAAVNVSISMESISVFVNIKSVELAQNNSSAQNALTNILRNTEVMDFLSGKETENFTLSSTGYDGKAISQLEPFEARALVEEGGFFSVEETSQRVSSFVLNMTGDNVEFLQQSRQGLFSGFNQAEKLWGGELPEISYETQEKTLAIIDAKIAELLKTDV